MTVVELDDGKYTFYLTANGLMHSALRHGEDWPAGYEMRFQQVFMAALWRIQELEQQLQAQGN